jgi:hypothetical protein
VGEMSEKRRESVIRNLQGAIENRPGRQPNLRHGVSVVRGGGPLPKKFEHLQPEIEAFEAAIMAEEAMSSDPTPNAKRLALVKMVVRQYTMILLCVNDIAERGLRVKMRGGREGQELQATVKLLPSLETGLQRTLQALGLDRKVRQVPVLGEYIQTQTVRQGDDDATGQEGGEKDGP